jgi:hypothetical protein
LVAESSVRAGTHFDKHFLVAYVSAGLARLAFFASFMKSTLGWKSWSSDVADGF